MSQACNARGHRSRNISCQAGSNGREGGQLDTDCPRSASDDPRGRPCKNWSSGSLLSPLPRPLPAFHLFACLWRRTHKKEYVTSADNSRFLSAGIPVLGPGVGGGRWQKFPFPTVSFLLFSSLPPSLSFSLFPFERGYGFFPARYSRGSSSRRTTNAESPEPIRR